MTEEAAEKAKQTRANKLAELEKRVEKLERFIRSLNNLGGNYPRLLLEAELK